MKTATVFLLGLLALPAVAEITPEPGPVDPRIRVVDYSPQQVYRIPAWVGRSTLFELAPGERLLEKMAMSGDSSVYEINENGSFFSLKPLQAKDETDITVFTTRGPYRFLYRVVGETKDSKLVCYSKDRADCQVILAVKFRYPEDAERAKTAEGRKAEIDAKVRAADGRPRNYNYRFQAGNAP